MRTSIAALALIRRTTPAGERHWLTQWNAGWQALNLVGGKKHDDESFRDCCIREIGEELGLPAEQVHVADDPLGHLEFDAWSQSAGAATHYVFEVFAVAVDTLALAAIDANPDNSWLTEAEIRAGQSTAGRAVSETVLRVLTTIGEIAFVAAESKSNPNSPSPNKYVGGSSQKMAAAGSRRYECHP